MHRPSRLSAPFGSLLLGSEDQSIRGLRIRVQTLLSVLLVTTNVVGVAVVVVLTALVLPMPGPDSDTLVSLVIAVPIYVLVAVVVGASVGTTVTLRALRWLTEGSTPTAAQRRGTLRLAWRLTFLQEGLWLSAVVVFTGLALLVQPGRAVGTALSVLIAGVVVGGVAYLLGEFALRPVAARALAGQDDLMASEFGVGRRMLVFWLIGTAAPIAGLMLVALLALVGLGGAADRVSMERLAISVLAFGAVVLVFGLLVTGLNSRAVVAPIRSVRDALLRVRGGDFEATVPVFDGTELGMLQSGFNATVAGLREREQLRDLFGRHVGRDVAAAATVGEVELGGELRVVSVLFVDLVGSTSYAADHTPDDVVAVLNRFFAVAVEEVDRRKGLVNKFIGDAVLAVFGAPVQLADHAEAALAAARAIAGRLANEVPEVRAGIGVATGEAVAGNIGDTSRFEYTVVGDVVNSAARLTELAKDVDGRLLAAWDSVKASGPEEAARWREHDSVTLRGRASATVIAVPVAPPD